MPKPLTPLDAWLDHRLTLYDHIRSWQSGLIPDEPLASVPCDGCTTCCQHLDGHPWIATAQEASRFPEAIEVTDPSGCLEGWFLPFAIPQADGSLRCSQLTATGCAIYDRRPLSCRVFDCRIYAHLDLPGSGPMRELWESPAPSILQTALRLSALRHGAAMVEGRVQEAMEEAQTIWEQALSIALSTA